MDDWEVAGSKNRRRKKHNAAQAISGTNTTSQSHTANTCVTEKSIARYNEAVDDARRDILNSPFYNRFTTILSQSTLPSANQPCIPSIKHLIIYGLGSIEVPGAVHIRYQLALAVLLSTTLLSSLASPPEAYDPVFNPHDLVLLPHLGIHVIERNEEGRRIARTPTLFFMPHCEADLTENVLQANIEAGTLTNVVILGNSFNQYYERWSLTPPSRSLDGGGRRRPEVMLRLVQEKRVVETRIPELKFPVTSAFNDMSLHVFTG